MLEYALTFFESYPYIFYALLIIAVILEGPLTVLAISLISTKLGLNYFEVLFFAFVGDYGGDLLHFFIGRSSKEFVLKRNNVGRIRYMYEMMENYSFFDKLIIIKYTPPLTSIGLLYMGFSKVSTKEFILKDAILCAVSSLSITTVGYIFGSYFIAHEDDFWYILIAIGISILLLYFCVKYFKKIILNQIKKKNNDI